MAINGTLGFLLQGSNISVYPGGEEVPVSTAAKLLEIKLMLKILSILYYLF